MRFRALLLLFVSFLVVVVVACNRRHDNDDFSPTAPSFVGALVLSKGSDSIPADGFSRVLITARITAESPTTRRKVRFETTDGQFIDPDSPAPAGDGRTKTADVNSQGSVSVELRSGSVPKVATITAKVLDTSTTTPTEVTGLLTRITIEFTPPDPTGVIRVSTSVNRGEADDATQIFVHADIAPGLPEGARTVTFETTLGTFVKSGSMTVMEEADRSNRATVALKSPAVAGRARITAKISQTTSETFLNFDPAPPDFILVRLGDTTLRRGGKEETTVTATLSRSPGRGSVTPNTVVMYSASVPGFSFRDQVPSNADGVATSKLLLGSVDFVGTVMIRARVGDTLGEEDIDINAPGSRPDITVTPSSLDLGSVMVGQTSERAVTIRNDGTVALTVSTLEVTGADFAFVNKPPLPTAIAPGGEMLPLTIKFTPTNAGTRSGALVIASDDPDESSVTVELTGVGQAGGS